MARNEYVQSSVGHFIDTYVTKKLNYVSTVPAFNMASIFFVFSFFAKNEEFSAIFREKRKKNEKKSYGKLPTVSLELKELQKI